MKQRLLLALALVLAVCMPSSGQILGTGVTPTFETSPMQANSTVTALQSTITAVQSVIQTGYALLDITPLDDLVLSAEFLETLGTLQALAVEGQGLMKDAEGAAADLEALFGLEVIPDTPALLSERYMKTTQAIWEARRYAVRTQSLISHITGAVAHIHRIVQLMGILAGNKQGAQLQIVLQAQLNQTLATQTLQQAAEQRVRTLEGAQWDIMILGWNRMQAQRWEGWPATAEGGN